MSEIDFFLDLEDNAKDSLAHGLEHFLNIENQTYLKYTILHLFHATELYLKARLAKAHTSLIYQRPEDSIRNGKTVDFDTLLDRLRSIGVHFSEQDIKDISFLRKLRNSIEHARVEFSISSIEDYIGRTVRFLESFLKNELNIELKSILEAKGTQTITESLFSYEEKLDRANKKMELVVPKENDEYEVDWCPKCGEQTVPLLDTLTDRARCYYCNSDLFHTRCRRCSIHLISERQFDSKDSVLCEVCSNPEILERLRQMNQDKK